MRAPLSGLGTGLPVVEAHQRATPLSSNTAEHQKYSGNSPEKFSSPFAFSEGSISEGSSTPAVSSATSVSVHQTAGQQIPQAQYQVQQMPQVQVQVQNFGQQASVASDFGLQAPGQMPPQQLYSQQMYGQPPSQTMAGPPAMQWQMPPQQSFGQMPQDQSYGQQWQMPPQQSYGQMPPQDQSYGQMPPQQGYGGPPPQMMAGPPPWQAQSELIVEGWLSKRAEDFGNSWQNRWFVLYGGGVLTYSKGQGGVDGTRILLDKRTQVRIFRSSMATDEGQRCGLKKQFGFEIYQGPDRRTWYLDPGSAEKRDVWIQALEKSIAEVGS